jgi:hypothetical protein
VKPVDEEQELTRLLAQEQSPLASGVGALRHHGPDAVELASLAARLALQGLDLSVSPPPAAHRNPWKKSGWGGLGGVSAVVVWLALRGFPAVPNAARTVANAAPAVASAPEPLAASAAPAQHTDSPPRGSSVAASRAAPGDGPTAGVADSAPTTASVVATAGLAAPSPFREAPKSTTAPASSVEDVHDSVNGPLRPTVAGPRAAASSAGRAATSGAPASGGTAAPPSEMALLRDARLTLHQSPASALELTEEHARLYPQGQMTQERELIAVSALVALGRRTAALARAASFERQYPTSPYRKQLGELLH